MDKKKIIENEGEPLVHRLLRGKKVNVFDYYLAAVS